jgi:hypothetical protein
MFSKAKEKQERGDDQKERARQKRIEELAAKAERRPPHVTGKR